MLWEMKMDILNKHFIKIFTSIFMAIIGVACGVFPYFATAKIVELIIIGNKNFNAYITLLIIILCGLLGSVVFHEISTIISHNLAFSIIEGERKKLVEKISRLSLGEVQRRSSGEWTQFMVETLNKLEKPIAHVIPEVIANIIIPVVLVVIIFVIDIRIGIANLITLPLGALFSFLMMGGYEEKSKKYQEASKNMNTTAVEYIRGIQVIKAFNKSASSYDKFVNSVKENRDCMLNWYLSVCFYMTAAMESIPSTLLFVLPTAMFLYMSDSISVFTLIMSVLLSYASYRPLIKAMSYMDTMANIRVILGEIKDIMNLRELEREEGNKEITNYDVEFKNVAFGYNDKKKILEDISFVAKEGQLTAIVGYSGSGKSTITKLIAGHFNVEDGKILIGNVDVRQIPIEQNMELVSYVSQENYLFRKSIKENMMMAKPNASIEEIEEACKKASCHDFIKNLPLGYDTVIGDEGTSLSGGERQRITIARAILKDSPIVLLDEATAYSDPDNETEIQKSIDALVKNKTVIVVAHRLSTISHADKIIVLNNGKIEGVGRHEELLLKSKTYSKMWKSHLNICSPLEVR